MLPHAHSRKRRRAWISGAVLGFLLPGFTVAYFWLQGDRPAPPDSQYRAFEYRLPDFTASDRAQLLEVVEQAIVDTRED